MEKLKRDFVARGDTKISVIYSLRNWLAYRFAPTKDHLYLEQAYHGAMTAHRRNEPNIRLLTLAVYMAVESEHLNVAEIMLDKAVSYRKFLMAHEPFYYGAICFLRAFLAIKQQKSRVIKKHRKAFTAYTQTKDYSPHYDVMEGQLCMALNDYPLAYGYLDRAYAAGCRSVYIYEGLYRCYKEGGLATQEDYPNVLTYAKTHGADIWFQNFDEKPIKEAVPKFSSTEIALTQFELTPVDGARYVYISQPEKQGMKEYEFPASGDPLIIDSTDNFTYVCLDTSRRQIITKPMIIKRVLPQATPKLYRSFYDKGDKRFQVLAYLASHYLIYNSKEAIPVFEDILQEKLLPVPYRMNLLASLGHMYYKIKNLASALECYRKADLQFLDGHDIALILEAYIQGHEYSIAAQIIDEYHESIPQNTIYESVCQLLDHQAYKGLAQPGYNLLLSGFYNENLLTFVLANYNASQSELVSLSNSLQVPDSRVDIMVLTGGLWSSLYTAVIQKAFRRLYVAKIAQKECSKFVELLVYAILTKDFVPEYETINTMEKIYQENHDNFYLLMALCHVYLVHKIITLRSDKLIPIGITAQEDKGILMPAFKSNKPYPHPYLEKYQPFIFHAPANKDIRLYYRVGDDDFRCISMKYLKYGLYSAKLPLFFNETITYYYSEERETGSIDTLQTVHKNTTPYLNENHKDKYFAINNALIYEQMFRHELIEEIAEGLVYETIDFSGKLL